MKVKLLLLFLLLGTGFANTTPPGQLIWYYTTTDYRLRQGEALSAMWKDIFTHSGDTAWAAFYAGRESVYREMLKDIFTPRGSEQ